MKKIISFMLLLTVALGLSGCWDLKELNEVGLVLLVGIDTNPQGDGFEITVHVHTPLAGPGGEAAGETGVENIAIISAQGQTVLDAFRNMRGRVAFQMTFHHARLIIIGEDLARKGVKPVLDFMLRTTEIRLNSLILVCEGSAKELMQTPPELAESLHLEIEGILRNDVIWSKTQTMTVLEFTQDLLSSGRHPVATRVFSIKPDVSDPAVDSEEQGGGAEAEAIIVQGMAVFNYDQMVGWLSGTETLGYRCIVGEGAEFILVVPWHGARAALEVNLEAVQKRFAGNTANPKIEVEVAVEAVLLEYTGYINLSDKDILDELESLVAAQIKNILQNADRRAKELNVDFLDYGCITSRQNPEAWKELSSKWQEIYPDLDTVIDVRVNLGSVGNISTPLPR